MIEKIIILGSGNVGWHLAESLVLAGYDVPQVYSRNPDDKEHFIHLDIGDFISDIRSVRDDADLYILCVNDDAIEHVAQLIPFKIREDQILVHVSGATTSCILKSYAQNYGCMWPLQTLKREAPIITNEIPIIITASNDFVKLNLIELADQISENFEVVNDAQKEKLHMAAVMANNFTNHIYTMIYELCLQEGIPFDLLIPLIRETGEKLAFDIPKNNQTGPAVRNDKKTIESHLRNLEKFPELYRLYCIFTENIIKTHHKVENY